LTRVAVIVHERLGNWIRQLRPRLHALPIRWYETRTPADMSAVLGGLACPVVLLDLGRHPVTGLRALEQVIPQSPDAWVLVLDPESHPSVAGVARELGATCVHSGFAPPPRVAELVERWIALALKRVERDGWSRTATPESETKPWGWLADYLGDPESLDLSVANSLVSVQPADGSSGVAVHS
jgi:hypothetical protein